MYIITLKCNAQIAAEYCGATAGTDIFRFCDAVYNGVEAVARQMHQAHLLRLQPFGAVLAFGSQEKGIVVDVGDGSPLPWEQFCCRKRKRIEFPLEGAQLDAHRPRKRKVKSPAWKCGAVCSRPGKSLECTICYNIPSRILWAEDKNSPATLADLPAFSEEFSRLTDDMLLLNPCRKHAICVACLRNTLRCRLRKGDGSLLACCNAQERCDNFFAQSSLRWVLGTEDWKTMEALDDAHKIPGFVMISCPAILPADCWEHFFRCKTWTCAAQCPLPLEDLDNIGRAIVQCTQNGRCGARFCAHCKRIVKGDYCRHCSESMRNHPEARNSYFFSSQSGRSPSDPYSHLAKNKDITDEIALEQLRLILHMDSYTTPPCFVCGNALYKTTQCNALLHCGVEKCYVCGRNSKRGGTLEAEHWTGEGCCPRFDDSLTWTKLTGTLWKCCEGQCFSDSADCKIDDHQNGIIAIHRYRKDCHLRKMLSSLPSEQAWRLAHTLADEWNKAFVRPCTLTENSD